MLGADWATWAQITGTAVQVVVLIVLIWQVEVNRRQAKVAEDTLSFAQRQHEDALKQYAQNRTDSVRPALGVQSLEHGQGTHIDGEETEHSIPTVTYELDNFGPGPAVNVSVSFWLHDRSDRPVYHTHIQGIGASKQGQAKIWYYTVGSGELILSYEDMFGTRYERKFDVYWSADPDGELYSYLSESASS